MNLQPLKDQEIVGEIKKTSDEWYKELYPTGEFVIYDPDGWDRQNYNYSYYEELITLKEFMNRVLYSTCVHIPKKI